MELIDEIKIELRVINAYNGNINLVEKAYDFIGNKLTEEYSKANEALKPYFYDYHSWKLITEFVFKPCKDICYFIDNPFKVMRYVKFYLTQYDIPFRNFIREMMIVVLEDSYRIKPIIDVEINVENKLKNVISEIKSIDTTKPFELREIVGFTDLEYLNDGKNFYDDAKRFILIHMSIEGCILSKVEVHERYISENFSPALIEAFEKSKLASYITKPIENEAQIKAKQIEYNIDNLKEIFYPKAIEIFVEIEKGFIGNGWIKNNAWVKEKNMLVSIILILENRGYFRKIRGKSKSTFMLKCRQFFESRYNINISKQMQPNQRKKNRLPESYEPSFQSISVIE